MSETIDHVVARCRVTREDLELWIERRWIRPARADGAPAFSETDIARVELICDLLQDMAIGAEAMDVILPLLDQVYALRQSMRMITDAVAELPEEARQKVLSSIAARGGK